MNRDRPIGFEPHLTPDEILAEQYASKRLRDEVRRDRRREARAARAAAQPPIVRHVQTATILAAQLIVLGAVCWVAAATWLAVVDLFA